MKRFFYTLFFIILIFVIVVLIYINKDRIKNNISTIELYFNFKNIEESEYTEQFKVNNIKVNVDNYYYNKLNDNQKSIYKSLANGIKNLSNEIVLKNYKYIDRQTSTSDVELAFTYFCLDHPEVFYLNSNYTVTNMTSIIGNRVFVRVSYSVQNVDELNLKIDSINQVIEEYLKKLENKTNFEAELFIHDELAKEIKYFSYSDINNVYGKYHTIEGAFLEKKAVCDGLTKAVQILLSNVDIENIIVLGKLENIPHAWNMVKLEDKWYNLDITSNKSIALTSVQNAVIHSYFNVSDEVLNSTHTFDNKNVVPVSKNLNNEYNYYIYKNKYISAKDDFKTKLEQIILNNEDNIIEFYTENTDVNVHTVIHDIIVSHKKNEYLTDKEINYDKISNTYIIKKNPLIYIRESAPIK